MHGEVAELERRVREAVAERERHLLPEPVVGAVSDEEPLAVADVLRIAGEVDRRRDVGEHESGTSPPAAHPARRRPVSTSAIAPPAAWPPSQHSTIAGTLSAQSDDPHHRAVDEYHDDVRVGAEHRGQQAALVGGKLDVGPVVALRLVRRRQPEHADDDVGVARQRHRLAEQGVVVRRVLDAVAGAERHTVLAEQRRQLVEQHVDTRRVDLRAAGTLEARRPRELTDHRHRALGRERQQIALVLEQHDRRRGRAPRERVMSVEVGRRRRFRAPPRRGRSR